jgi:dipeptidase E
MPEGHIVAMGGGDPALDAFLVGLTASARPRVCFIGTATGDNFGYALSFFERFSSLGCTPTWLPLFGVPKRSVAEVLAEQDVIYVGGGNTASMLAVWQRHGVDVALRDAWYRGVVLSGPSAGAICWFDAGVTDSFRAELDPIDGCLGFLGGSFCPHYDSDVHRAPTYRRLIASGRLPAGYAADDGVALHFRGTDLAEVITARDGAAAYRLDANGGQATEERIAPRVLRV